ncbi:MAG TPA: TadE family protein, partial [Gemmataceae bacterium]|nr:TadE family protein [Gemmataceae bacterium]
MITRHPARQRGGATTVEFAFVAILLFMMLFAIFEYGRFLFMYHVTTNAARDAARFAVVHTNGGT